MKMKSHLAAGIAFGLILGACSSKSTPGHAPALSELTIEQFRDVFNSAADRTRVLALLSPT